MADSN